MEGGDIYRAWTGVYNVRAEGRNMMSHCKDDRCVQMAFQGQEFWIQARRMALWAKSQKVQMLKFC